MSDIMRPISFPQLIEWVMEEAKMHHTILSVARSKIYYKKNSQLIKLWDETLDTPIGSAAGPHTQLAQNIAAAYLCGGRFFELKTVQILDALEFPKPCIWAEDEGYNTEWSTELTLENAFDEYVKAWFLVHFLQKECFNQDERRFMFNMSVGYSLQGIKSPKVDRFIESLKDAANTKVFKECKASLLENLKRFEKVDQEYIERISSNICTSITLSTMHGCPPAEIEAITRYLIEEKKLHTFVKMNPTLLGYRYVRDIFDRMGYSYIDLKQESFTHDLQYADGIAMLTRLKEFAKEHNREFGIKLSNTLPVRITQGELPGDEMYMSGRALYPLTINLAFKLASEFKGDIRISYSGGADFFNVAQIFETGIRPITLATSLLKPGGYTRFKEMAERLQPKLDNQEMDHIDLAKLKALAESAFQNVHHRKDQRPNARRKIARRLPMTDCFTAPCSEGCPIGQDIPEYTRLVGEERYSKAFEVVVAKNPLPFITGTICNHNCMNYCTRLDYEESIKIRDMKLLAAQNGYDSYMKNIKSRADTQRKPKKGLKTAIIGGGPSGLAAGYFLAKAGFDVTVMDKRERAGGTVEYVIPAFRISREAISKDIKLIENMGVRLQLGVNPEFSISKLKSEGYTYIYIAIGASKTKRLELEGDSEKVLGAIPFLEAFNTSKEKLNLGKHVAVIGGGNSAVDAARAAKRVQGVEKVYTIYRRTKAEMPADLEELESAVDEGIIFKELLTPISLRNGILTCQKMELGQPDESGRRRPIPKIGEIEEFSIDTVLSAIGEQVDYGLLQRNGIEMDANGNFVCDPSTLETNLENVFLGGDALTGPSTVIEGMAQGIKAAQVIAAREGLSVEDKRQEHIAFDRETRLQQITSKKGVLKESFPNWGEAQRCLECKTLCNICTEVCPNRANVMIKTTGSGAGFGDHNQILHIDGMCNECGNCATFCPYDGAPYREKLTLYWTEEDFALSQNSGFLFLENEAQPNVKVRFKGKTAIVSLDQEGQGKGILPEDVYVMIKTVATEYRYLFTNPSRRLQEFTLEVTEVAGGDTKK